MEEDEKNGSEADGEDHGFSVYEDVGKQIGALKESLVNGFSEVLEAFERRLAYDEHKERQIDRLHSELQEYKADLLAKALRPIFSALIRLHDDIDKMIGGLKMRPPEEVTVERMFKVVQDFHEDIEILLRDHGVEAYQDYELGDEFNGRRQQAAGLVATDDAERQGRIAERLRPGFQYGQTVLQKERVKVFRQVQAEARPAETRQETTNDGQE